MMESFYRNAVLRALSRLEHGALRVEDAFGSREFGKTTDRAPTPIVVRVLDPRAWRSLVFGGSMGGSDSFIRGDWQTDDLTGLLRVLMRDERVLGGFDRGLGQVRESLRRLGHRLRRNTRSGSPRNIRSHYDLGNDFFAGFLDPTLTYSAGLFEHATSTLEQASVAKYERICRKLELGAGDRVLEIGTGWGGFALHAARTRGCHVTTTTLSAAQHNLATERTAREGLGDRVNVLHEDYRALSGRYDKLVSIEMVEAVGHQYFDTYLRACAERLEHHGRMALQGILIDEPLYERARRTVDFIKWHIFPGGCLPSLGAITRSLARIGELRIVHLEDLTSHYVRTLACWRERFALNRQAIRALGYPEALLRTFEFYFSYCEAGFMERRTSCAQIVLEKHACQQAPILGELCA